MNHLDRININPLILEVIGSWFFWFFICFTICCGVRFVLPLGQSKMINCFLGPLSIGQSILKVFSNKPAKMEEVKEFMKMWNSTILRKEQSELFLL